MNAESGTPEADELELLAALVEMYEERQFPIQTPDPIEAVKFRIDQLGIGQKGLIPFIGSRSKVSEILNRKKPISLAMMRALHKGLGIPAEVLLQEPGANFPSDLPQIEWDRFPLKEIFFQAEDGIRDSSVTGVQTCALPISSTARTTWPRRRRPASSASRHRGRTG